MRRRLLELGMSKEDLASKMGCSIATVYNMLGGRRPSEKTLYKVAQVLGVEMSDLIVDPNQRKLA